MARIPLGGFGIHGGNAAAPVVHSNPNTSGMTQSADAMRELAQTAGNAALRVIDVQAQMDQKRRNEEDALDGARATNRALDYELKVRAGADDIANGIQTGTIKYQDADAELDKRLAEIEAPDFSDVEDPVRLEAATGQVARLRDAARFGLRNTVENARRVEGKTQVLSVFDNLEKLAARPDADIEKINSEARELRTLWKGSGLDESQFEAKIKQFSDKNWQSHAQRRYLLAQKDPAALQAYLTDLTADDGFYANRLDPDQRNQLHAGALSGLSRLEAKAAAQENKREAIATRAMAAMDRQWSTGVPAPAEQWTAWGEAVKGTSLEPEFAQAVKMEAQVQQLLQKPPAEQQAYVQELTARQQRDGATVAEQATLKRFAGAVAANVKTLRENPLLFHANRTGEPTQPLDLGAMLQGNVDAVQTQVAERMATVEAVRKQYGPEAGRSLLLPQEASMLAAALKGANRSQSLKFYGLLNRTFNDPAAYKAVMAQVAPGAGVRAHIGMLYAAQRDTTITDGGLFRSAVKGQSGDIADTMLRGLEAMGDTKDGAPSKKLPMPSDKDLREVIAGEIGTAFRGRPAAFNGAMDSLRAYYAGKADEAGDVSGEIDEARVKEAVRAVLGNPVDVNGRGDVFPPWGMDDDDFEDALESAWATTRKQLPEGFSDNFSRYGLQQARDGLYYLVDGKGEFVHDANKVPIALKVGRK